MDSTQAARSAAVNRNRKYMWVISAYGTSKQYIEVIQCSAANSLAVRLANPQIPERKASPSTSGVGEYFIFFVLFKHLIILFNGPSKPCWRGRS